MFYILSVRISISMWIQEGHINYAIPFEMLYASPLILLQTTFRALQLYLIRIKLTGSQFLFRIYIHIRSHIYTFANRKKEINWKCIVYLTWTHAPKTHRVHKTEKIVKIAGEPMKHEKNGRNVAGTLNLVVELTKSSLSNFNSVFENFPRQSSYFMEMNWIL